MNKHEIAFIEKLLERQADQQPAAGQVQQAAGLNIKYHNPRVTYPDMSDAEVGDYIMIELKDGTTARFDVTDKVGDIIRLDSHDGLFESVWNESGSKDGVENSEVQKKLNDFYRDYIPDGIKHAAVPTEREYATADGKFRTFVTNAFMPDMSELFETDDSDWRAKVYDRMDWYKDRRNRIKQFEDSDDAYWTQSASSGYAAYACIVNRYGNASNSNASAAYCVPVCFQINTAKL